MTRNAGSAKRKLPIGIQTFRELREEGYYYPYEWHTRNDIAHYEGYYASVFYPCFAAQGFDLIPEESSARGHADMAFRFNGHVYLFEFKTVVRMVEGATLAQLGERGYADKYRHLGEPTHLIGVEFSRAARNIAAFAVERA